MSIENVLYRAHAEATGGREGRAVAPEGGLDLKLTRPKGLGGKGEKGTNPEELFAAGYSACFIGAMQFVAARDKIAIPTPNVKRWYETLFARPGVQRGFAIKLDEAR